MILIISFIRKGTRNTPASTISYCVKITIRKGSIQYVVTYVMYIHLENAKGRSRYKLEITNI